MIYLFSYNTMDNLENTDESFFQSVYYENDFVIGYHRNRVYSTKLEELAVWSWVHISRKVIVPKNHILFNYKNRTRQDIIDYTYEKINKITLNLISEL